MYDLFEECGVGYIKIVGGGGGIILFFEIKDFYDYGIDCIYLFDDGWELGF